jgi:hypothetical protein
LPNRILFFDDMYAGQIAIATIFAQKVSQPRCRVGDAFISLAGEVGLLAVILYLPY